MQRWSMVILIAIVALLMPMSTASVSAQGKLGISKSADLASASIGDTITYTYIITYSSDNASSDNASSDNITIENISLVDDKIGPIDLGQTSLGASYNITVTATYTVSVWDFLRGKTLDNTATVTGTDSLGNSLTASDTATVTLTIFNKEFLSKFEILKLSGVPGKGIEKAPGLQKPFNPKSQAAEHAGKKGNPETPEQLQERERVENQGAEQQLQITSEVKNQAGGGQALQDNDNDEAKPGKGQLNKNWSTDNQTGEQEATGNGHKPDKDKKNNKPKSGK